MTHDTNAPSASAVGAPGRVRPVILGLGGTTRPDSSSERALRISLEAAERLGAETVLLSATSDLDLPMYRPEHPARSDRVRRLLHQLTRPDGLLISTPGYHGGLSGLLKNALDYIEGLRDDERPYLEGRAVGCVVCASGWQATTTTVVSLRSIVHALRGWPTPLAVALNSAEGPFDSSGAARQDVRVRLETLAEQVFEFAAQRVALNVYRDAAIR